MNNFVSTHTPTKPFVLAPSKSPEEIERESINVRLPELRRNCSRDKRLRRHTGAKWLFDKLTDLSVMFSFGGDGRGRVRIAERDLERIFGVRRDTIMAWRLKLISTGWIWYEKRWPRSLWGICGLCCAPEHNPNLGSPGDGLEAAQDEARAGSGEPDSTPLDEDLAQNGQFSTLNRPAMLAEPAKCDGGTGQTGRQSRPMMPAEPDSVARKTPPDWPEDPASLAGLSSIAGPENRASLAGSPSQLRSLQRRMESKESIGGQPPPSILEWESRLKKMFPRELEAIKSDLVKQLAAADSADLALRDDLKDRLAKVETQLFGRPVKRNKPAKPAPTVKTEPQPATEAELLEGARYLVETKKLHLLNGHQLAALAGVGEYPFKKDQPKTVKETIDAVLALDARRAGKDSECKPTKTAE